MYSRHIFLLRGSSSIRVSFFTDAEQQIDIFTGQIDFSSPWGNTNFEAGVKTSLINSESGIQYF
jgi:hypothetical protein